MEIGIIGQGYVGDALKCGFENKGFTVKTYDKFKDSDSFEDVTACDFIFICVPTPSNEDGSISLSAIDEVITNLSNSNYRGIAIIKSTVVPGTTQGYQDRYPELTFIASPEFLKERSARFDFLNADKIIIGHTTGNRTAAEKVAGLFKDFTAPKKIVASEEAEMIKYMVNAYLYTRVIFANEIYDICQAANIDYEKVRECFELDKRVAPGHFDVLYGDYRGAGGHCLLKDLDALISKSEALALKPELFETLRQINKRLMET